MSRKSIELALLGLILSASLFVQASVADDVPMTAPEKIGMYSEHLERLDRYMQELIDARQRAGVCLPDRAQGARWLTLRRAAGPISRTSGR